MSTAVSVKVWSFVFKDHSNY